MINVLKASGEKEPFDEEKLKFSIKRAGIPVELQNLVLKHVKSILYDNIPTLEIYQNIIKFLKKSDSPYSAASYSLKQAIMNLGPSGHPFEDYFAEILKTKGYLVEIRQIVDGEAIKHEIDIIASKLNQKSMIECKFHNSPGIKTDAQVALFTKARFDDVRIKNKFDDAWVVTNTKITKDFIDYSLYYRMKAISWNYPANESLREMVESTRLFPITILTSLSQSQKQHLLENHLVLCRSLNERPACLDNFGLSEEQKKKILEEVNFVLGNIKS